MSVYFIRTGAEGPFVKIGTAIDVQARLCDLECASPFPLVLIREIPGGYLTERWLHARFADRRVHREWFSYCDEMLDILPPELVDTPPADRRAEALNRAIAGAGGVSALARALGVTRQAICQWTEVPAVRALRVEAVSGVRREELRPDLYLVEPFIPTVAAQ
jgi:hypothetical protein